MYKLFRIILLSTLLIGWKLSYAQVFPVQASTQLVAPYSLYLSDYVSPATERLVVTAFLNDVTRPELNVRFRLKIIGQGITIETKPEYIPSPVSLQGGVPLRLVSADLAEYFNPQNLNFSGITRKEYEQRGKLPEGVYQFCFEVLEYNRGAKISNSACATAWMILNDPPIINIPQQNAKLIPTSPQNVIMQWTPRHTGSPNSAFTTEYEIRMVEVWPSTRNPNDAILTSPPIFETTTQNSTIIYGPAETPLELGRRYAFRVRAKSIAGVDELDLFKNNGYSEVFTFVYGDACSAPGDVVIESVGSSRFKVKWASQFNHTSFKIRYRQAGTQNWYANQTSINEAEIYSLKPNTTYEYEVSGTCGFFEGAYSSIATVKTKEEPSLTYSCGLPLETFSLDPAQLQGSIKIGDVIQAGDFDVQVSKISGGDGVFSGEGVIVMSFLKQAKVKASFDNITVNKDMRMVKGFMNVTGAGVEIVPAGVMNFMDKLDEALDVVDSALSLVEEMIPDEIPNPASFVADTLVTIKGEILAVVKNPVTGNVIVTTTNGQTQELAPGTSYAVKDSKGNGYLVDSNGNVGKTTAALAAQTANREYNLAVVFNESTQAKYGFDKKPAESQYSALEGYEQLEGGYRVAWKAVATNTTDPVIAKLEKTTADKTKIYFQQNGIDVSAAPFASDNTTTVSVKGNVAGDVEDLTAIITPADTSKKEQILGKLKVITYDGINNNLVIVPVNNVKYPSTDLNLTQLKTQLNKIYAQAAVSWNVSLANEIDVALSETFDDGESGLLANYTGDMKSVINAYKSNFTPNTYYLFLVDKPASGKTLGFMPRSKQAGFIFVDLHGGDENLLIKTIAHELGHGAFTMKHTFDPADINIPKGQTHNLMDYTADASDSRLIKIQWDRIHNPVTVLGLFEDDEEGASIRVARSYCINSIILADMPNRTFYDLDGKVIFLDGGTPVAFIGKEETDTNLIGKLLTFMKNGRLYHGFYHNSKTPTFAGYAEPGTDFNKTKISLSEGDKDEVIEVIIDKDCNYEIKQAGKSIINNKKTIGCSCQKSDGPGGPGDFRILDATNHQLAEEVYEKLKSILGGNRTNRLTGSNHVLNGRAILTSSNETLNLSKVQYTNGELFFNEEPVLVDENEILFWISVDDKNYIKVNAVVYGNLVSEGMAGSAEALNEWIVWDQKSLTEKAMLKTYEAVDGYFTALYDLMDLLSTGISKLQLPETVYNPDATGYNAWYAKVFSWLNLTTLIQDQILNQLQERYPKLKEQIKANPSQIQFAFFCGVYNGLIDVVKSLPDLMKLVLTPLSSKGRETAAEQFQQFANMEITILNPDGSVQTVVCSKDEYFCKVMELVSKGISEMFDSQKPCVAAYNVGAIVGPIIVLCIGDIAAGEAVAARVANTVLKIIRWCDKFSDPFRYLGMTTRVVKNSTGKLFLQIRNVTGNLIEQLENGLFKVKIFIEGATNPQYMNFSEQDVMTVLAMGSDGSVIDFGGQRFTLFDANGALANAFENVAKHLNISVDILTRFKKAGVVESTLENLLEKFGRNANDLERLAKSFENLAASNPATVRRLAQDISGNQELAQMIKDGIFNTNAWETAFDALPLSILRKDPSLLKKLGDIIGNKSVLDALGGEDGIKNILNAYKAGKCKSCGNKGYKYLIDIDEHFTNIESFVIRFKNLSGKGFDEVVQTMSNPNTYVQDGLTHMLKYLKKNDGLVVEEFEKRIADGLKESEDILAICDGCLFDAKLKNGSYLEFKSYSLTTIEKISGKNGAKFVKQFKQYLQTVTKIEDLRYIFNASKIDDITTISKEFQKLFAVDYQEIFRANEQLFKQAGIPDELVLKTLAEQNKLLNHKILSFIRLD